MPDHPLQPFQPPAFLTSYFPHGVTGDILLTILFYFAVIVWAGYTIIGIYHWLKYSHGSWVAIPAILAHVFVSFVLIGYTLSSQLFR